MLFSFFVLCARAQSEGALFALKVLAPQGEAPDLIKAKALLERELRVVPVSAESADQVGLILLKSPESVSADEFQHELAGFVNQHSKNFRLMPTTTTSGTQSIPTGRIIIQFKDGILDLRARAFLTQSKLKIVQEPTRLRPTRFVVEPDSKVPGPDPVALAKNISANPDIRFAEADMLFITPTKPSMHK